MFSKLKIIKGNPKSPQHIIDMAKEFLTILNTKFRDDYRSQIQSFVDKNSQYLN